MKPGDLVVVNSYLHEAVMWLTPENTEHSGQLRPKEIGIVVSVRFIRGSLSFLVVSTAGEIGWIWSSYIRFA